MQLKSYRAVRIFDFKHLTSLWDHDLCDSHLVVAFYTLGDNDGYLCHTTAILKLWIEKENQDFRHLTSGADLDLWGNNLVVGLYTACINGDHLCQVILKKFQ